jgi:hypothetical protein
MSDNEDFALLVGKAFLHEIELGHRDQAIAFGRAFLLALGMKGPEDSERAHAVHGGAQNNGVEATAN